MSGSLFGTAAGFMRGVGKQAAVSVAASAIAAAVLALPGGLSLPFFAGGSEPVASPVSAERWVSPVASDGKIRERHHEAAADETSVRVTDLQGLISPAAIVMPMSLEWTQPVVEIAALPQMRPATAAEPRARAIQAQALPPRRPVADRPMAMAEAAPLQIAPAAMQVMASAPAIRDATPRPQRSVLGVRVPAPVSRVGDALSGAVGLVGAAGTWTLSRASDLLPGL